jgi:phage terminase large subunit-like protein
MTLLSEPAKAQLLAEVAQRLKTQREAHILDTPADPLAWIESAFYIPETNGAIRLEPYQRAVLRELYRTDANGDFLYSTVVWGDIKKSGKSSVAAAIALERARRCAYGSVRVVANDLKQADSRVAFYARRAIDLNPALRRLVKVKPSGYKIEFPNRAVIEAIPVDPKGEAGGGDDLVVFSELWAANQKAALRMWTELTLSPLKYGKSQRLIETYAGYAGESPLLEQLYDSGARQGEPLDLSYEAHDLRDLEVYANPAARLLVLWNTRPRCPWQTDAYYTQEAATLTPNEFQRVHRNQWVSSVEAFVEPLWWNACLVQPDERHAFQLKRMDGLIVGIDAGLQDDAFAIVAISRRGERVFVQYARKWTPPKAGTLAFGSTHDPDTPVYELARLAKSYNVVQFRYDPWQMEKLAQDLYGLGLGWFLPVPQASRSVADSMLYNAILQRQLAHQGHPDLTEHILNANRKAADEGKIRIVKRSPHLKIDLCVALSMALQGAYEVLPG